MAVTSQIQGPLKVGEFIIHDWQAAGLLKPSAVKAAIATVEMSLVRRRLGHISVHDIEQLDKALRSLLGL
jgi:mRNA interferase MazF